MSFKRKILEVTFNYQENIMGNKSSSHHTLAHEIGISTTKRKRSNTQASHHRNLVMQEQQKTDAAHPRMIPSPAQVM